MSSDVVVLSAKRSAVGKIMGGLRNISAVDMGIQVALNAFSAAAMPAHQIDQSIIGCVLQAGQGMNVARQVALGSGVPEERPAYTVNQVCGSGLKSLELATQLIQLGESQVVLAGGVENMSQSPFLLQGWRGQDEKPSVLLDSIYRDGLLDVFEGIHMGISAERLAEEFGITRHAQDLFALQSQQRYWQSCEKLKTEITPVACEGGVVLADENPRRTTREKLASLSPAFQSGGTVTAGNSSSLNDGAAIVVLAARDWADAMGYQYSFIVRGFVNVGVAPGRMGLGPVGAIRGLWDRFALNSGDIDLYEINEAFAAQTLAVLQSLNLSSETVNVNGGAIALGHPLGASGARVLVTLIHEMARRDSGRGIASLCIGGGMGISTLLERC